MTLLPGRYHPPNRQNVTALKAACTRLSELFISRPLAMTSRGVPRKKVSTSKVICSTVQFTFPMASPTLGSTMNPLLLSVKR
eukprot:scaffold94_cov254-Pinguiococcus_pyrenoidosus.AAC.4